MTRLIDADALTDELIKGIEADTDKSIQTSFTKSVCMILCKAIEQQPTIDAVPQWIPCSERMPENMEPVNITWVNRDPVSYYMHIKDKPFTATGIYFKGKWYWWSSTCDDMLCEYGQNEIDEVDGGIEIVAWMPLPKPYEVEE